MTHCFPADPAAAAAGGGLQQGPCRILDTLPDGAGAHGPCAQPAAAAGTQLLLCPSIHGWQPLRPKGGFPRLTDHLPLLDVQLAGEQPMLMRARLQACMPPVASFPVALFQLRVPTLCAPPAGVAAAAGHSGQPDVGRQLRRQQCRLLWRGARQQPFSCWSQRPQRHGAQLRWRLWQPGGSWTGSEPNWL